MDVEIIVPFTGSCAHRARAWRWLQPRYEWPVTVSPGPEPWCKALAVMPAIARSRADVVVVADADVWTDGIHAAIAAVAAGEPWAVPHRMVHRLTEAATAALIAGEPPPRSPLMRRAYWGIIGGGIIVAHRELLRTIPLDPQFVGWGQEDQSWGAALATMLGPPWRGDAPLSHLYHPPSPRINRKCGSSAGWSLWLRYEAAYGDPAAMNQMLQEALVALDAAQPDGHDLAAIAVG